MPRFLIAIVCAALVLPASGRADPTMECSLDAGSQVEIGTCVNAQLERVDAAMEQALQFARDAAAELDGVTEREAAGPALDAAQTAWERYRDGECAYQATLFGGGSGAGISEAACRVTLTRARIADLMGSLP